MASTTRTFARAFARQTSSLRVSSARLATPSQTVFRAGARRAYSSQPPKQARSTGLLIGAAVLALGGASAAYSYSNVDSASKVPEVFKPTQTDYQKVYDAIAKELVEKDDYDDGSYGPVSPRMVGSHGSSNTDNNRSSFALPGTPAAPSTQKPAPAAPTALPCASRLKATTVPTPV